MWQSPVPLVKMERPGSGGGLLSGRLGGIASFEALRVLTSSKSGARLTRHASVETSRRGSTFSSRTRPREIPIALEPASRERPHFGDGLRRRRRFHRDMDGDHDAFPHATILACSST